MLKRLDKAIEDGDPVRAVIRASGVNSDGWIPGQFIGPQRQPSEPFR